MKINYIPPYPKATDEPRLVHIHSDNNFAIMRCGLLRNGTFCGSRDIIDGKLPTCMWCVVGRY